MKGLNAVLRNLLLALIFAIPFIPFIVSGSMFFPFITGKNFTFRILTEILFAGWLILLFNHPEYRPRFTKITIAVLSLLGILALATVFGENPYRSFWSNFERMEGLITHIHLAAYFLVASSIITTEKLWRRFFQVSLIASVGIFFYVVAQISGSVQINQGATRVDATLGNATYLAVYVLFHVFFALYFLLTTREKWLKWAYGLIALANAFALYKTGTRGTILGLIGGVFLFSLILAWRGKGQIRKISAGAVIAVLVLIGGFVAVKDSAFIQQSPTLSRFASISATDTTTESRFLIWNMSLQGFKEHPLLGWGPENYNLVFDKYYNPKMWRQEPWFDRSHNVFFDWLINAGVLGLAAYLSLFGLVLWYVWRSKEELVIKSLITALLAGYFVHNIFVFDNLISYIFFFSILAWVNAVYAHGNVVEEKTHHSGHQAEADSLQYMFAGVVVLVACVSIYFLNIRPINASQELIQGIIPNQDSNVNLNHFNNVFALNTFGSGEAREQLLQMAIKSASRPDVPEELKLKWLDFAGAQMNQAIISGRQNDARSNLIYSGFLSQLGGINNNFYDQAIERLEAARKFSPNKQSILMQESLVYVAKGNKEKALELAKIAFDLEPSYPEARKTYIVTAVNAGKDDLAKELAAGGDDPNALFDMRLINIYVSRGQFDKVLEIWQKRVEFDPTNTQNHISLAGAYVKVGKREEAIKVLRGTISLNPDPEFKKQIEAAIAAIQAGRDPY